MQRENITSNDSLNVRLTANREFGSLDFHRWVFQNYKFAPGMDVLDVGCGNGVQALEALRVMGSNGSVSAVDLSPPAVAQLTATANGAPNLQAIVGDMRELGTSISETFKVKKYDLAHSTYALYYAGEHVKVLEAMRKALKPDGRMIVTTPIGPNTLRQLVNRLGYPTPELAQIDNFNSAVLEPYFRSFFNHIDIQIRRNVLKLPTTDAVATLYRSTAYYLPEAEAGVLRLARAEIESKGFFAFEKNAYMIIGSGHAWSD